MIRKRKQKRKMIRKRKRDIVKALEAKGFYGTLDRLKRGVITEADAWVELRGEKIPEIKGGERPDPVEFATELKARGVERKESWSRWIQRTGLKPGMDAKDWFRIYDSV